MSLILNMNNSKFFETLLKNRSKYNKYDNIFSDGVEFVFEEDDFMADGTEEEKEEQQDKHITEKDNTPKKEKRKHQPPDIRFNKRNTTHIKPFKALSDAQGLQKAYDDNVNNVYVDGDTLYISGTKNAGSLISTALNPSYDNIKNNYDKGKYQDVWDDLKIPFHQTAKAERYKNAEKALTENPNIKNLTAHSLGSSVAYELQKNYPDRNFNITAYGSPVISKPNDPSGKTRWRHPLDLVSIFDRGANVVANNSLNPHSFEGFDNKSFNKSSYEFGQPSNHFSNQIDMKAYI